MVLAGSGIVVLGVALRIPAMMGWGGAMLLGLIAVRELTQLMVLQSRLAGLEMKWRTHTRLHSMVRGGELHLELELSNRDRFEARFRRLRVIASGDLDVQVRDHAVAIAPGATLSIQLTAAARRTGRQAIHGVMMELEGPLGLFLVPLGFASPVGLEVLPQPTARLLDRARGGRSRRAVPLGAPRNTRGEGTELFELREHSAGDAFKRIAWKASARRGQLMVKELERDERDVVWLVLDGSPELWAGQPGRAPLDGGIDAVAALAARHLARGDRVGLVLAGTLPEKWLAPEAGPAQGLRLSRLLAFGASTLDADRTDLTEEEAARIVLEHLRFLDPTNQQLRCDQLDAIVASADAQRRHAIFQVEPPAASTPREQALRWYMASFGLLGPPVLRPDRAHAERALRRAMERAISLKPRPTLVYVWAPAPSAPDGGLADVVRRLRRRGTTVLWMPAMIERSIEPSPNPDSIAGAAAFAVALRARASRARGEQMLRAAGVKVIREPSRARRVEPASSESGS